MRLFFPAGKCGMYFVEDNASDTIENSVSIRSCKYCIALIFPNCDHECLLSTATEIAAVLELEVSGQDQPNSLV